MGCGPIELNVINIKVFICDVASYYCIKMTPLAKNIVINATQRVLLFIGLLVRFQQSVVWDDAMRHFHHS